jgi:hypothetical protein
MSFTTPFFSSIKYIGEIYEKERARRKRERKRKEEYEVHLYYIEVYETILIT